MGQAWGRLPGDLSASGEEGSSLWSAVESLGRKPREVAEARGGAVTAYSGSVRELGAHGPVSSIGVGRGLWCLCGGSGFPW